MMIVEINNWDFSNEENKELICKPIESYDYDKITDLPCNAGVGQ